MFGLALVIGFVEAGLVVAGLVVATLCGRFEPADTTKGFPLMILSLALLVLVWRTVGALLANDGAGRALKVFFFASSASFCSRASLAALSLAATASPGSWKLLFVGALVDFGGGGGVGK